MTADNPRTVVSQGSDQKGALKINDAIYQAVGFGNTYLVTTMAITPAACLEICGQDRAHHPVRR